MKYIMVVLTAFLLCASLSANEAVKHIKNCKMNDYKPQKSHLLYDTSYLCDNHYVHLMSNDEKTEFICYLVKIYETRIRYLGPIHYDIACFHFPYLNELKIFYVGPKDHCVSLD